MPADWPPVFVNSDFRKTFSHSNARPGPGAWSRDLRMVQHTDRKSRAWRRTLRTPQPTSTSLPPPPGRSPLIGWAAASALCHWPEVRRRWAQRDLPQSVHWRASLCPAVAVPGGSPCSATAEKRPARRRFRYVGTGRKPRARGGWPGRQFLWRRVPS